MTHSSITSNPPVLPANRQNGACAYSSQLSVSIEASGSNCVAATTNKNSRSKTVGVRTCAVSTQFNALTEENGEAGAAVTTGHNGTALSLSHIHGAAVTTGKQSLSDAIGEKSIAAATGRDSTAQCKGEYSIAVATNNNAQSVASNNASVAVVSGYKSTAHATHETSVALSTGTNGEVSGVIGSALFLCERDENDAIVAVWAGIVGMNGIEPDKIYKLLNGIPTLS